MPRAIPARHLVIEIADFHNKVGKEPTSNHVSCRSDIGSEADVDGRVLARAFVPVFCFCKVPLVYGYLDFERARLRPSGST